SGCSDTEMLREWRESRALLGEIIGQPVTCGSVPGGFYSSRVAGAAARAGLTQLFTSEPVTRTQYVHCCRIIGRFMIQRSPPAETAAGLARADVLPRLNQFLSWNAKKAAKAIGGNAWFAFRRSVLSRIHS